MRKFISVVLALLIFSSAITPAVLAGEDNKNNEKLSVSESINDYQEDLFELNKKIAKIYREINTGPKSRGWESIYVHSIETAEETAELIGGTNKLATLLSTSGFVTENTSLSSQLLDVAVNGFSPETRESLIQAGYTSQDIALLETKVLEYNAYLNRISAEGFNSEEIQTLREAGYNDSEIEALEEGIRQRYSLSFSAVDQLNASKYELYQVQVVLSVLSLKLLINSSDEHGKVSSEQLEHLGELEQELIEDISKSNSKNNWEHIRNGGKEIFKYSEMLIKKSGNASAFSVDYFIGLQVYLGAITALEGDEAFALNVIDSYKPALEDLADKRSVEKDKDENGKEDEHEDDDDKTGKGLKHKLKESSFISSLDSTVGFEAYKIKSGVKAFVFKAARKIVDSLFSIPVVKAVSSPIVGQVDELREDNNVAEITITVTNPSDPELDLIFQINVFVYTSEGFILQLQKLGLSLAKLLESITLAETLTIVAVTLFGLVIIASPVGLEFVPLPIPVPESWNGDFTIERSWENPEIGRVDLTRDAWWHIIQGSRHLEITEYILSRAITEKRKPRVEIWKRTKGLKFLIVWKNGEDGNVYLVTIESSKITTAYMAGKYPALPIPNPVDQWTEVKRKVCLNFDPTHPFKYPLHIFGNIQDPLKPYTIAGGGAVCG
ncbi:MAG: hypothetical protein D6813_00015 [Calditrichaeota bacterium]|nr:MAG: hypothetical protein D6813_00015 [Calditrichota bacterium]